MLVWRNECLKSKIFVLMNRVNRTAQSREMTKRSPTSRPELKSAPHASQPQRRRLRSSFIEHVVRQEKGARSRRTRDKRSATDVSKRCWWARILIPSSHSRSTAAYRLSLTGPNFNSPDTKKSMGTND
nr:hypothetical protein CFP56_52763 [Quercus suber]